MNVYVVGAGVSKAVGYPLGSELLTEVDAYVRSLLAQPDPSVREVGQARQWPKTCDWLSQNPNPLIKESYRAGHFEHLLTVLDSAFALHLYGLEEQAARQGRLNARGPTLIDRDHATYVMATSEYNMARNLLHWALGAYLHTMHHQDFLSPDGARWEALQNFARRLRSGDVIITFNYDSTLERVLLRRGQWAPDDGYGMTVRLVRSRADRTPVRYGPSPVKILHLHGAFGWYPSPLIEGAYTDEANGRHPTVTPEMFDTPVRLDEEFLAELGIPDVDEWTVVDYYPFQVILQPSYLKAFGSPLARPALLKVWREAAVALRSADRIFLIGYSLPEADSAALALMVANCEANRIHIVNNSREHTKRLRRLLTKDWFNDNSVSFEHWLSLTDN